MWRHPSVMIGSGTGFAITSQIEVSADQQGIQDLVCRGETLNYRDYTMKPSNIPANCPISQKEHLF